MNTQRRHELIDEQWERIIPLLPPQRPQTGRPNHDHRTVINGILWILRTGAPWRDLPTQYGRWQTVYSRFRRWKQAGVWERMLGSLQQDAADEETLDGSVAHLDGSNVRAHQDAAGGGEKGGPTTRV
jgi:transposase